MEIERSDSDTSGGHKIIKFVYRQNCQHCNCAIKSGTVVVGIGYPHHTMVHHKCAPFYKYSDGYPHDKPWEYYVTKTR